MRISTPHRSWTASLAPGALLGRLGDLEVRLAGGEADVAAAQRLRHEVFREELGIAAAGQDGLDRDRFDEVCDHLLVLDTSRSSSSREAIVGTYRLLRQDAAGATGGFYSDAEFELGPLIARHRDLAFLELGRSCVRPPYRSRRTIELLWQGIWAYVRHHGIDVMTGCASFPGTVPAAHARALSFLAHNVTAKDEWAVRARPSRFSPMDLMPAEAVSPRAAMGEMPPLVKGYLRLGGTVGEGCVIDPDFGTTDILIVLPVSALSPRYVAYYGAEGERFAA